jgi:hypothetical protein
MTPLEHALALVAAGIPVFPCGPHKRPLTAHGFHDATADAGQVRTWWTANTGALVGVPTGHTSGILVVDVDPEGLPWLTANRGRLSTPREHHTRRGAEGGRHVLYRMPAGQHIPSRTDHPAEGVDVRGNGGYMIWWPAHGLPAEGCDLSALPAPPEWLAEALARPATAAPAAGRAAAEPLTDEEVELVRSALGAIPADCDRDTWVTVGRALASRGGPSDELFVSWSSTCPDKFPGEAVCRRQFCELQRSRSGAITLGSLFHLAGQRGWRRPPRPPPWRRHR